MNVMIATANAWDDTNSVGNTLSNFFSSWDNTRFSNIYFREAHPANNVCTRYYRISDRMLARYVLCPQWIGNEFMGKEMAERAKNAGSARQEEKLIALFHRFGIRWAYKVEDLLWRLGGWRNDRLRAFLDRERPDIVFAFAIPTVQHVLVIEYLKQYTKARVVLFIADDVYGRYLRHPRMRGKARARRFRQLLEMADKLYGASEELCHVYGTEFHRCITPLYKGCSFVFPVREAVDLPIRITYAGNLLYGRLDTLSALADAIEVINNGSPRVFLEVYSGTPLTTKQVQMLNRVGSARFCGRRPYAEIQETLNRSDIVLHVESFERKQVDVVRYSFSTKIIDCLQSGSVLMVIGPRGISSVEYVRRIPGTVVVDDLADLQCTLTSILDNADDLPARARAIRSFAQAHHSLEVVRKSLQADFQSLFD